ncbi:MAG: methyltransferase domain-containing protein [Firmicutes bacterium]|nr:methyltransferase domain-containing protein [Bacillota bacterium]
MYLVIIYWRGCGDSNPVNLNSCFTKISEGYYRGIGGKTVSREFFNQVAENWDERVDHDNSKIRFAVNKLPAHKRPNILDVGTGTGVMLPFLEEYYGGDCQIAAVDFAENMLEIAKKKYHHYQNIQFIRADIYKYQFNQRFDLIITYSVFPHLRDKVTILERFYDLLKDGGSLLIFHSQSREEINQLHHNSKKDMARDDLPPVGQVIDWAERIGYKQVESIDNDKMYLLILRK